MLSPLELVRAVFSSALWTTGLKADVCVGQLECFSVSEAVMGSAVLSCAGSSPPLLDTGPASFDFIAFLFYRVGLRQNPLLSSAEGGSQRVILSPGPCAHTAHLNAHMTHTDAYLWIP